MLYEIKTPRILTPQDFSNTEVFQTTVRMYDAEYMYKVRDDKLQTCKFHELYCSKNKQHMTSRKQHTYIET